MSCTCLHHADKAESQHHGLPENPEISETVKFWKGVWKPLARSVCRDLCRQRLPLCRRRSNRAEEEDDNLHEEKRAVRK